MQEKHGHRQLSLKMQYIEFSMYITSNTFHRMFRPNVHWTQNNIKNITLNFDKLTPFKMIIRNAYLREQPCLFKPISFDVITFELHQIRCNVHAPNKTLKKIRRIAFSVITVHEGKNSSGVKIFVRFLLFQFGHFLTSFWIWFFLG